MSGAAQTLAIALALAMMAAGLAGTVLPLPLLPGTPLIWLGLLVYGWSTGFAQITAGFLAAQAGLALLALLTDPLGSMIGARRFGATRHGAWGAIVGGLAGLLAGGVIGALIGPVLGAFAGELLAGRPTGQAWRAGLGTLVGIALGTAARFAIGVAMVLWFAWRVWA